MSEHEANTRSPVVAIGASAGGLEQISTLLGLLPDNTGAAFVVMQHLSAARKSQLPELLSRTTTLPVIVIEHDMALEPDRVHVMPENCALGIKNGRLQLLPKKEETTPTVIDSFMRALAEERTEKAIGIILSGSGNDGALGLKAIKLHGGLSMVQDPDTAEHPSTPRAAIAGATPDYVRNQGACRAAVQPS
ncbi:two-component system chemotaxis family CheB-CheR fusion protein [Salinisphaera shabanensis E1L3A]|uniref:protein-glutamate methylesterase n=1 Tax=Salinisphaera shabanensis E1L3A TaxID=1033802 RepID=U2EHS4_9GAMM|nr:chemotaxis protein CheB [Salinisphaera shabanensis]ERJ17615.1 two-component system chemotaxis family CheB-CheR fusion protein [Salinisphaera shabanensis E1L3A]